jgi:hypothetical protein
VPRKSIRRILCSGAKAEDARRKRTSLQNANVVIPAQIAKQKSIDAQAEAEKQQNEANVADAIFAKNGS